MLRARDIATFHMMVTERARARRDARTAVAVCALHAGVALSVRAGRAHANDAMSVEKDER
jgi:hypothetical protein